MTTEKVKRKLTAILSADVKGYSRLMGVDEVGTIRILETYRGVISDLIQKKGGRVVDSPGDNVLAEFASVVDALESAVEIQKELKVRNADRSESRRMEFRIGINLGDVVEEGERIYGDGVNIAARIEGLAEGGGICISGTAFDHIGKRLPLGYEYMGEQEVKNIEKPVRVYRVLLEPEQAGKVIGEKGPKRTQWWWAPAAGALVVLVAVGLVWNFYWRTPKIEPASKEKMAFPLPDKPSIAVLPFVNMSGDPQQEFFSDGLTEDIITALSKMPNIFVIARNSTFTYKGKPMKIQRVAEDLGVRYVLEGSVQRSGDRVRITAQLIDALKGYHLWSERYEGEMKELFALQDMVALETLRALDRKLSSEERSRILGQGTQKLEAYLKVLQSTHFASQWNKESNVLSRQLAEEAIRLDSNYPSAYYRLAMANMMDVWLGISKSPKESLNKAIEMAKACVSLDASHSAAHSLLGFLYVQIGEHERGIAEAERAVETAPGSADAYSWLAQVLNYSGKPQDAIPFNEKALRLNPLASSPMYHSHAAVSFMLTGRYEDAVKMCKEVLSRWPSNVPAYAILVQIYGDWGRDEEARLAAQDLLRIDPKFSAVKRAKSLPFKDLSLQTHYLELLRKAGLPD